MDKKIIKATNTHRAVGFAIGVLKGILLIDLPEQTEKAVKEAIKELDNLMSDLTKTIKKG